MDYSNQKVLSFEEGCKFLGYTKSYAYKLTSGGILPYSKPGKRIYFEREELERWMLSNKLGGSAEREIKAATHVTTHKNLAVRHA